MRTIKCFLILVIFIMIVCLSSCKSDEILFGEISGEVLDGEDLKLLQDVTVILNPLNDTMTTTIDGEFLFKNLDAGNYQIQVTKPAYEKQTKSAVVSPAETTKITFVLDGAPIPELSAKNLDFGLDSTVKLITISNKGKATLKYSINTNQQWITVFPFSGEVTDKQDTLAVTINKTGLSNSIQKGEIIITSIIGQENTRDTVNVFVNGVMDRDFKYYKVVKIGTQTWMAENLNVGKMINGGAEQADIKSIKKYCYNNDDRNCAIFGGLYTWPGMMQGAAADNGNIGTTRGICPVGWHLPTNNEWNTLTEYLYEPVAGVKLKEAGITHWRSGNVGTNESGFTALPGGRWNGSLFDLLTTHEYFWSSTVDQNTGNNIAAQLEYNSEKVFFPKIVEKQAVAVRCIKDLPKKK